MKTPLAMYCIAYLDDNQAALESINLLFPNSLYLKRLLESKIHILNAKFTEAEIELNTILLETFENDNFNEFVSTMLLLGYIYWRKGLQSPVRYILQHSLELIENRCSKADIIQDWLMSLYYNLAGNHHYDMSDDADDIYQSYFGAYSIHRRYFNRQELARALNNIGVAYYRKGDLDQALFYYLESLKENKELTLKPNISANLLNIGEIYLKKGQLKKALQYFEDSLQETEKRKDLRSWAIRYIYISKVYDLWGEYNIALEYLYLASTLFTDMKNDLQLALVNTQIGKIYLHLEKYDESKDYFAKSLTYLISQTRNDFELSETLCYLIDLNNRIEDKEFSDRYFNLLQDIASKSSNPHVKIRADVASIVIKKDNGRLASLVTSIDQIEKLISKRTVDIFITYDAIVKYTEILIKELEILNNEELISVIQSLIEQIYQLGNKEGAITYYLISQTLKSKFYWIRNDKIEAVNILEHARNIAVEKELSHEITRIDCIFTEYRNYMKKIGINNKDSGEFLEKLNEIQILDYLNTIQQMQTDVKD